METSRYLAKEERKEFSIILLIVFIGFVGISMPYLIFPSLFLNPDCSILPLNCNQSKRALLLGITLAAYPFGQFIGSPILGSLSDEYGRKWILAISLVICAFCYLLTGVALYQKHLGLLIASRMAAGVMEGNIAIARAMATELSTLSKHKSFGRINASGSIAYLVGPLLGGLFSDSSLSDSLSMATPFYLTCLLFFLLSILSITLLKNREAQKVEKRSFYEQLKLWKRLANLFSNKKLRFLMIISIFFSLAINLFYEFGPVHLTLKWQLNPKALAPYNALLCVALAIGNGWLCSFLASFVNHAHLIILSLGSFALLLTLIALAPTPSLMIPIFIFTGLTIGLGITMLTVTLSNSVSPQIQGEVMGVQLSMRVLADAIICLLGGILLQFSSELVLLIGSAISLATMLYYLKARKFRK